jgi:hypothetical protein
MCIYVYIYTGVVRLGSVTAAGDDIYTYIYI